MIKPKVNRYYQHRHGGLYKVQDVATSTVDKTKWVVYSHCYPFEYQIWIRPYDEWCDGRFKEITNDEYQTFIEGNRVKFQEEITRNREIAKPPKQGDTRIINEKIHSYLNGEWVCVQG